ncbi:MAG: hypothetical protein GY913_08220 [Proteobacteria bacterium]|nr:hypothetical protein [Pseudomonadota bacterium]MCP4916897.1 hypothetical protein [Pseudomonadota bacterium]
MTPLPELAREAERLRFRQEWHLPVDPARVVEVQSELLRRHPWHPLALNIRALEVLPETGLPSPGDSLAPAARLFARGDLAGTLAALVPDPRTDDTRARVLLLLGELDQAAALADRANRRLPGRPSLLALRGRIRLGQGDNRGAWGDAIEALVQNPLHGGARVLLRAAGSATGRKLLRIPLRAPVRPTDDGIEPLQKLSDRALAAWRAWHRAGASVEDLAPGAASHLALLTAWRGAGGPDERFDESDHTIQTLDRWQRSGLLTAYEWSTGLTPATAEAFRTWNTSGHEDLRRFWRDGLLA